MINAALVSAQNRKRLFWTNIPNVKLPDDRGIFLKDILQPKVDDVFTVKPKSNTVRSSGRGSGIDDKHNWDAIRIGSINKGGQGDRKLSDNEIIRKLTPVECERLQSLPDNYTDGVSNAQRYKCLGNAFNVEVVAHILKGIANQ
jgi:DNA (cytosine-5)-methyltransferase 3A